MRTTLAIAAILALTRVWVGLTVLPETPTATDVFKDVAHLFMGGLFMGWYLQRQHWQWRIFWAMNVLEGAVAVLSRI